jgi:hypothetical protein
MSGAIGQISFVTPLAELVTKSSRTKRLKESMIRTQRAFVFVKVITIEQTINPKPSTVLNQIINEVTGWKIAFQLENSGETPTQYMFKDRKFGGTLGIRNIMKS